MDWPDVFGSMRQLGRPEIVVTLRITRRLAKPMASAVKCPGCGARVRVVRRLLGECLLGNNVVENDVAAVKCWIIDVSMVQYGYCGLG